MEEYKIRIVNTMFGYERDQIIEVKASSEAEAINSGLEIDFFADVTVVE